MILVEAYESASRSVPEYQLPADNKAVVARVARNNNYRCARVEQRVQTHRIAFEFPALRAVICNTDR